MCNNNLLAQNVHNRSYIIENHKPSACTRTQYIYLWDFVIANRGLYSRTSNHVFVGKKLVNSSEYYIALHGNRQHLYW